MSVIPGRNCVLVALLYIHRESEVQGEKAHRQLMRTSHHLIHDLQMYDFMILCQWKASYRMFVLKKRMISFISERLAMSSTLQVLQRNNSFLRMSRLCEKTNFQE